MAYSGPEYWSVIYKAVADFGDVIREAEKAKAALKSMSDAARAEGATETEAATKSATAHRLDTTALNDQRHALDMLTDSAKRSQQWTEWGGRNDPGAHLSDMAKTLEYKRLINIQNWLTFTNPQTAYAWREKERQQAIQMNYAVWGGYTTPDQYLGYLQRQRASLASLNDVLLNRAQIYRDNASAALSYENALSGTHATAGTLSEHLDLSGISQFQSALAGLPDTVTTRLAVDDTAAISELAKYRALLKGIPREVSTSEVVTAATLLGGATLDTRPQVVPVSYGGPYKAQFAAILAEVAALSKLHAQIPVHFELPSAAQVASFVSQIPTAGISEPVHLVPQGGAVGVGAGPPPETIAAWKALSGAESGAAAEAKLASSAESVAAEAAARAASGAGALAAAWNALSGAEKAAYVAAEAAAAANAAGAAGAASAVPKVGALTAAWEALSAAEKDAAVHGGLAAPPAGGGGGKPPAPPPAAAAPGAEPPRDAAAKWAALSAAEKDAAAAADLDAVKFAALAAAANGDAAAASQLAHVYQALGGSAKDAGDKATTAAAGFGAFSKTLATFAGFGTTLALFGGLAGTVGVVHLIVDAVIELIAVAVLAAAGIAAITAALVLFGAAGYQAGQQVVQRLQATQVAATATGQAIYPLTGAFAQLQATARPAVWQLYGDALNQVGNHADALNTVVQKTGQRLDQLAAKMIVFVSSPGFQQGLKTLVSAGIGVLHQLGDIFRNLGQALVEFAKVAQATHIAEDLLAIINAGAKLLELILKLPTPILAAAVGLHAFYLWGGLLATGLIALLDPLRAVALGIGGVATADSALAATAGDASGWAKLKAVLADIGNGFAALPGRIAAADSATKAVGADMALAGDEAALMSGEEVAATAATFSLAGAFRVLGASMLALLANPLTWLVAAAVAIGIVSYKIFTANDNTQKWITGMDAALSKSSVYQVIGKTVSDLAATTQNLAAAQKTGAGNASELAAAQTDLSGKLQQELVHVGAVSHAYGVDMPTALDLLNVAGVKTDTLFTQNSKTWAAAMVQVAGLVQGYKAMGQGLTQLQGDVSVQLVMNADQLAQMGKLNTAWDSWLKLVESGPSAFVAFEQGVQTVTTNMKAAGASFGGTNAASLTLRASWDSLIPTAGNVLDAVRSYSAVLQNGADGSALLVRATKDLIASSGQMSSANQQVRNSLIAVAEQADPSINTWQKLTQWIGPLGAAKATSDLDKVMTLLQTPVTNLQKDAALLTTTLQQDLNPAMANATFNALGGQKAFNTFATDLQKLGPNAKPTIDAAHAVAVELIAIDKNTKTAHDQFVTWAESMGLSKDAANKLWAEVSKGVTPINAVRDGLAKSATASDHLDKSGFFAGLKDRYVTNLTTLGHFFTTDIPNWGRNAGKAIAGIWDAGARAFDTQQKDVNHFFTTDIPNWTKNVGGALSTAWSVSYQAFQRDFAGKLTAFFTQTVPHNTDVATHAVSTGWSVSYQAFQRDFAGKLTAFFTQTVPHNWDVFSHAMSTGWGTAYNGFQRDLAGPITHWATVLLPKSIAGQAFSTAWGTAWNGFNRDVAGKIENWFAVSLPHALGKVGDAFSTAWGTAYNGFQRDIIGNLNHFFTGTVQGYLDGAGRAWNKTWSGAWTDFIRDIWNPFSGFFTGTVQGWFDGVGRKWNSLWSNNWSSFVKNIWNPFAGFWTNTVQGWFDGVGKKWNSLWSNNWASFVKTIWNPFAGFFTGTVQSYWDGVGKKWNSLWSNNWHSFIVNVWDPFKGIFTGGGSNSTSGQFDSVGRKWNSLWSTGWTDFVRNIINPMSGFFTRTLPNLIAAAVKGGVNRAISDLNTAIHIINDVTHIVGIPKIGDIGHVAAAGGVMPSGGSIAGTGDEDGTHIIAMGGEYMVRKPARMALEAKYGRNFMNTLNQADTWLGAGSRGNTATQRAPHGSQRMAAGGDVNPIGPGLRPERIDMGVDYGGAGPLFALNHGTITNLYNSGWPGGAFVGLRVDQGPEAGKYWYYAEDVAPLTRIGATVGAGQHIANATGGSTGIEVGFAAPPGSGMTMAAATGQQGKGGDPGGVSTGWGKAASDLIASLGGPRGILQGAVSGGTPGISGGFAAIWQNVLGLLDATGGSVTKAVSALGKYVTGGAVDLLNLAKSGSRALFDGVWSGAVDPILNKALPGGTSIPANFLRYSAAWIKSGVDSLLGAKDSAAQSSAAAAGVGANTPGHGLVPANAAPIAAYLASHGLNRNAIAGILGNIEQESGGNPNAGRNPPGRGLIQILGDPGGTLAQDLPRVMAYIAANGSVADINAHASTPTEAAVYFSAKYERPGNPQIQNRIAAAVASAAAGYASGGPVGLPVDAYEAGPDSPNIHLHSGSPGNAGLGDLWASSNGLQQMNRLGWAPYDLPDVPKAPLAAGGLVGYAQGDVISAIKSATANQNIREAMALGSRLESGWSDTASGDSGTSFGPYQIHLPAHPGVTKAQAENAAWATNYMLPSYASGVKSVASSLWSSNPETASEEAAYAAERPAQTYFASQGTSAVNAAWSAALSALGAAPAASSASSTPAVAAVAAPVSSNTGISSPGHEVRIQPGAQVPIIAGHQAGPAHNMLVAADMVPTAAAGQLAYWYATGSTPPAGSAASTGMDVSILADPGATAIPLQVPNLAGYSAGTAHNILAAAGFKPVAAASQAAWWAVTGTSPGAGSTAAPGATVTIIASPNTVMVPVLVGYTAGAAHDALVATGLVPTDASAGTGAAEWNWYVTGTAPVGGTMVQPGSKVAILATASSMPPSGAGAAANWPGASTALTRAVNDEIQSYWALSNNIMPAGPSTDQWGQWHADLGILNTNQYTIGVPYGSWQHMGPLMATPSGLTTSDWLTFNKNIANQLAWIQDKPAPPSSVWGNETKNVTWPANFRTSAGKAPGQIPPSAWAAWKYENARWSGAKNALTTLNSDALAAYGAWQALYGPAGSITTSPPTPGLQVLPVGGGPVTIDIEALVPGGPAHPVMALQPGSTSATGMGFASGGPMPAISFGGMAGGGEVSLADVAGQFAMGGFIPRMPSAQPGLASMMSRGAGQDNPRTVSSAAGAASGDRVGVKIGNITVNNPVPEQTSDSITRSSNRLAYLAGRGPV